MAFSLMGSPCASSMSLHRRSRVALASTSGSSSSTFMSSSFAAAFVADAAAFFGFGFAFAFGSGCEAGASTFIMAGTAAEEQLACIGASTPEGPKMFAAVACSTSMVASPSMMSSCSDSDTASVCMRTRYSMIVGLSGLSCVFWFACGTNVQGG